MCNFYVFRDQFILILICWFIIELGLRSVAADIYLRNFGLLICVHSTRIRQLNYKSCYLHVKLMIFEIYEITNNYRKTVILTKHEGLLNFKLVVLNIFNMLLMIFVSITQFNSLFTYEQIIHFTKLNNKIYIWYLHYLLFTNLIRFWILSSLFHNL